MRVALWALATGAAFATTAAAADPQVLSFAVGEDRHEVPPTELESMTVGKEGGLTLCFSDAQQQALSDFTAGHIGDTVTVAIGEAKVFFLQVVEPYDGGCIDWPLPTRVAESYRARLLGNAEAE